MRQLRPSTRSSLISALQALWQISAFWSTPTSQSLGQHNPVHLSPECSLRSSPLEPAPKTKLAIKSPESPGHKHKNQKGTTLSQLLLRWGIEYFVELNL